MSDDIVEEGAHRHPGAVKKPVPDAAPADTDRDTTDQTPAVEGGQPAVGDDRPRNTEF